MERRTVQGFQEIFFSRLNKYSLICTEGSPAGIGGVT